jgi:CP family cyanate transporter-like MFS transporter
VLLVAMNLRPAFTSLGPVLPDIRLDLGLSGAAAAVLTGLPVLSLGILAPIAPLLSRRFGIERSIGIALVALGLGLILRALGGVELLVAGTVVAGGAIAIGNVLLPVIVKRDFPDRTGRVTGLYTATMSVTASLGAAITIPLGEALGTGWRGGLAAWALPVVGAIAVWMPRIWGQARPAMIATPGSVAELLRDRLAWQVTIFLGLQSLGFYAMVAWLPSVYRDLGLPAADAGLLASVVPLAAIAGGLTVPAAAARARDQRAAAFLASMGTVVGFLGILAFPLAAPVLWVVVVGVCQGAGFPLALTLVVLRTRTPQETQRLSAMAQTVGYMIAALGPLLMGSVHDAAAGWAVPLAMLAVLTTLQAVAGLWAGRAAYVGDRRRPAPF